MMIKALILVHLWSFVVAGVAWALQRDGNGRVGARFPASNIWLILIALSLLPGVLYLVPFSAAINLPKIEALELLPISASVSAAEGFGPINYLAVYIGFCLLLMSRTLWRWSALQRLSLEPTGEPDIFTTTTELPPLTLSWPKRAVVIPRGLEAEAALISHERAHLRRYDAELTLLLLLLQDLMLRNPGISYLVQQWRQSIELRADRAATAKLNALQRKDYAALLLNIQRPTTRRSEALPCPTGRLSSTPHRNAKMRLIGIMEDAAGARQRRWGAAVLFTTIAASGIGLMSAAATVNNAELDPDDYVIIDYVKKTPLQLPANCPGLIANIKSRGIKFEEKDLMINGELATQHIVNLGTVILSHDVRRDGTIYKPSVLSSTHPCFEANAKAAITEWTAEPHRSEIKNVAVKLYFTMSEGTREGLNQKLINYAE